MGLLYLRTFIEVVKCGSYTRAAIELDYAQSSVTNHIQKLEELYGGMKLLERRGKQMKPTSSGELLFDYAQKIIELHREAKEALDHQEIKSLSIGTVESLAIYFLPPLIDQFKQIYPDINVRIIPTEKNNISKVKEKDIDFGLVLDMPYQSNELEYLLIKKQNMGIIVPEDHPFACKTEISLPELTNESFILTEDGCTYRSFFINEFHKNNFTPNISMELSSVETIKKMVEKRWGIGFLPKYTIEHDVHVTGLKALDFINENLNFYTQLIYRKDKPISKVFQTFIDLIKSHKM